MEAINLSSKENIINAYGLKPTLFFMMQKVLQQNKRAKTIKIEKTVEDKKNNIFIATERRNQAGK